MSGASDEFRKIKDAAIAAGAVVVDDEIVITTTDYSEVEKRVLGSMKGA